MYRSRVQLGVEIPLAVLCVDGSDTPGAPAAAPTIDVFSASGKIISGKPIPAMDRFGTTGLFGFNLFLDARFAVGLYSVIYRYTLGSFQGMVEDTFEIVAGGHSDGAAIAMFYYDRPHARFLVREQDSGKLVRGRNPAV